MMGLLRGALIGITVTAIAAMCSFVPRAHAQAQRVGVCLESVNATTGANQCADGWTPLILNGLKTTAVTVKASPGQLGKLYCYNPNNAVAYIQLYNATQATTETALLAATNTPVQSYGIAQTSANGFAISVGDWYGTAISIAAATTATGTTQPTTGIDCNVSYN